MPQVSSGFRAWLESCSVTCIVKEFTSKAREKITHAANKATGKEINLSSMAEERFLVEGKPELELFRESRP